MGALLGWLIVGAIAGGIASLIVPGRTPGGWLGGIIVGILGGILGGWLLNDVLHLGLGVSFIGSIFVAVVGAVLILFILRALSSRRAI